MKCLFRHLFLEDTSKKARVTKKMHLPNCGEDTSQVPCLHMPKFGLWLAKTLTCDMTVSIISLLEALPSYGVRRRDVTDNACIFARLEMNCLRT